MQPEFADFLSTDTQPVPFMAIFQQTAFTRRVVRRTWIQSAANGDIVREVILECGHFSHPDNDHDTLTATHLECPRCTTKEIKWKATTTPQIASGDSSGVESKPQRIAITAPRKATPKPRRSAMPARARR